MEFIELNKDNQLIFKSTYIKALTDGFIDFKPVIFLEQFSNNFETYLNEIESMHSIICYYNKLPIGVLVFGKSQIANTLDTDAEIDSIYFLKEYHGKGFAQKTIDYSIQKLKDEGFKRIVLWCSTENKRAWRFYEKNCFLATNQSWDDVLDGKTFHNKLLVREL